MPPKKHDPSEALDPVDGWPVRHWESGRVQVGTVAKGPFARFTFWKSTYPDCDSVSEMVTAERGVRRESGDP